MQVPRDVELIERAMVEQLDGLLALLESDRAELASTGMAEGLAALDELAAALGAARGQLKNGRVETDEGAESP